MTRLSRYALALSAMIAFDAQAKVVKAPPWQPQTIKLSGDTGWDLLAVESIAHRLFITRDTRLEVIDLNKGVEIGEIPGLNGAHGVAFAPEYERGFVTSGRDNKVVIFDLRTLRPIQSVPTGEKPDAVLYQAQHRRILTFNAVGHSVTVINVENGEVVSTTKLGGQPELAAIDLQGRVFVNLEDQGQVQVLDPSTFAVVATYSLGQCQEPTGLAIDRDHGRLFAACANHQMTVLSTTDGKILGQVPIGSGPDGAAFDPGTGSLLSPNGGDGTLTIAREDRQGHFQAQTVPTKLGARTLALDPTAHVAYLPAADYAPASKDSGRHGKIIPGSVKLIAVLLSATAKP